MTSASPKVEMTGKLLSIESVLHFRNSQTKIAWCKVWCAGNMRNRLIVVEKSSAYGTLDVHENCHDGSAQQWLPPIIFLLQCWKTLYCDSLVTSLVITQNFFVRMTLCSAMRQLPFGFWNEKWHSRLNSIVTLWARKAPCRLVWTDHTDMPAVDAFSSDRGWGCFCSLCSTAVPTLVHTTNVLRGVQHTLVLT